MNIAAVLFFFGAMLTLFPMMGIAWAERLYGFIAYVLVSFIALSITAHLAFEAQV